MNVLPAVESRLPVLFDPVTGNFVISLARPNPSLVPGAPAYVAAAQFSGKTLEQAQAKYAAYVEANRAAEQKRQRNLRAAVSQAKKNAANASAAVVKVNEDGTATVLTGTVETGQGSLTVLGQIAAEELGIAG